MSMLLWYGDGEDDAIDCGPTLHVLETFGEIASIIGDADGYQELQSLPGFAEQRVSAWWLAEVRKQASRFLHNYRKKSSEETRALLGSLAAHIEHVLEMGVSDQEDEDESGESGEGETGKSQETEQST